jgi:hypothetical protein
LRAYQKTTPFAAWNAVDYQKGTPIVLSAHLNYQKSTPLDECSTQQFFHIASVGGLFCSIRREITVPDRIFEHKKCRTALYRQLPIKTAHLSHF